jgi:hypothetical protein
MRSPTNAATRLVFVLGNNVIVQPPLAYLPITSMALFLITITQLDKAIPIEPVSSWILNATRIMEG